MAVSRLFRCLLPLGSSAALLLLAGCNSDATPAAGDPAAAGKSLYLTHCSACHQPAGGGLSGAFPPLAKSDWLAGAGTDDAIALVLGGRSGPMTVNGVTYHGSMPPFAHLSDADIAAILGYVYRQFGADPRDVGADDVAAVRAARSAGE